jgi:hypothetical protein
LQWFRLQKTTAGTPFARFFAVELKRRNEKEARLVPVETIAAVQKEIAELNSSLPEHPVR